MATTTRLLTDIQVSKRYSIPLSTLRTGRCRGFGPPYVRLGRTIRYRVADLESWINAGVVRPEQAA